MAKVVLPIAKGVEELEAVALIDVMRRGGIEVKIAYLENKRVEGANGIILEGETSIDEIAIENFDMIVLPGGWGGTYNLADNPKVISLLKEAKEQDKIIGALCAAPFVLKKAEVLGDNYTCYPQAKDEIDQAGYRDDKKVIIDGNVMTSKGPGTAVCFGLAIIEKLVGKESMEAVKGGMLLNYCN